MAAFIVVSAIWREDGAGHFKPCEHQAHIVRGVRSGDAACDKAQPSIPQGRKIWFVWEANRRVSKDRCVAPDLVRRAIRALRSRRS